MTDEQKQDRVAAVSGWKVNAYGDEGIYKLHVSVTTQNHTPASGVPILAINPLKTKPFDRQLTDQDGSAILSVEFDEQYCKVLVQAVGTRLDIIELRLFGASFDNTPPPIPDFPDDLHGSWNPLHTLRVISKAWKAGGEAKRLQAEKKKEFERLHPNTRPHLAKIVATVISDHRSKRRSRGNYISLKNTIIAALTAFWIKEAVKYMIKSKKKK